MSHEAPKHVDGRRSRIDVWALADRLVVSTSLLLVSLWLISMFFHVGLRTTDLSVSVNSGKITILWMKGNFPIARPFFHLLAIPFHGSELVPWLSGEIVPPSATGELSLPLWIPAMLPITAALLTASLRGRELRRRRWNSLRLTVLIALIVPGLTAALDAIVPNLRLTFPSHVTWVTVLALAISPWLAAFTATHLVQKCLSQRCLPGCYVCGYDLTGNVSGRCPECGASVAEDIRIKGV